MTTERSDELALRREVLRQSIAEHRSVVRVATQDLAIAAREKVSLGEYVARSPAKWLAGAALVGLFWATHRDRR